MFEIFGELLNHLCAPPLLLLLCENAIALEEERPQQVWDMAHDEHVSHWIAAIAQRLQAVPNNQASFKQLCQSLAMPRVEVWLGVLLGEFELELDEEFYSDSLWVKAAAANP